MLRVQTPEDGPVVEIPKDVEAEARKAQEKGGPEAFQKVVDGYVAKALTGKKPKK